MSQDDLARAMGYKDRSMITKIESGKVDISQKKILTFPELLLLLRYAMVLLGLPIGSKKRPTEGNLTKKVLLE